MLDLRRFLLTWGIGKGVPLGVPPGWPPFALAEVAPPKRSKGSGSLTAPVKARPIKAIPAVSIKTVLLKEAVVVTTAVVGSEGKGTVGAGTGTTVALTVTVIGATFVIGAAVLAVAVAFLTIPGSGVIGTGGVARVQIRPAPRLVRGRPRWLRRLPAGRVNARPAIEPLAGIILAEAHAATGVVVADTTREG